MTKKRARRRTPTHIDDLAPDPKQTRKHTPRNLAMIGDSLERTGAWRSIGIDAKGVVRMGAGVVAAAKERGLTKVKVVDADPDELVAVRRRGLTEKQMREASIADNRTGEFSDWDGAALKAAREDGIDLAPFFTETALDKKTATAEPGATTVYDQAIQLRPRREFIIVMCAAGEAGDLEFARLREKLSLGTVRRGGYRRGSPFDESGVQRVVHAKQVLGVIDAHRRAKPRKT